MNEVNRYNIRVKLAPYPSGGGQKSSSIENTPSEKQNYYLNKEEEDLLNFKMLKMWGNFSSATLGRPSQEDRERKRRLREAQMKQIQMELTLDRKVTTVMKAKGGNYSIFSKGRKDDVDNGNNENMGNDNITNKNLADKLLHRSKTFRMDAPDILEDLNTIEGVRMRTKSLSRDPRKNSCS